MTNQEKPTVGVNLSWLIPGKVGGSEEHLLRLLRALDDYGSTDFSVRLYVQPTVAAHHSDLPQRFELREVPHKYVGKGSRIALENSWLAYETRNDSVVHHGGGVIPLAYSSVPIMTLHDLQPLEMPQNFSRLKQLWLKKMIPYSVKKSRFILAPSRFTCDRAVQLLGADRSKMRVVQHGSTQEVPATSKSSDLSPKERFGRYLLYPAVAYAHKNHGDIIDALSHLAKQQSTAATLPSDDIAIVFTGTPGPLTESLKSYAHLKGMQRRVHHLGRVSTQELTQLYEQAAALVFPSTYEGFGNPIIEAMEAGCPVICSNAGALPEIAGDAAQIFPAGNSEALAAAIEKVLRPGYSEKLVRKGRSRAKYFSHKRAGETLTAVYREALDSRGL